MRAPGEQDLTAHVNFTALELWGAAAGLETLGRVSQSRFLLALARANDFADLYDPGAARSGADARPQAIHNPNSSGRLGRNI